jgi:hypothetical protein
MTRITTPLLAGAVLVSGLAVPLAAAPAAQASVSPVAAQAAATAQRPRSLKSARTSVKRARALELQAKQALDRFQQTSADASALGTSDAATQFRLAQSRLAWAKRWLLNTRRMKHADGAGTYRVASQCRSAGVAVTQCQTPRWSERHLKYDTVVIGRTVEARFPGVHTVGGWRRSDPYPDHPRGRAADIMMPHAGHGKGHALGNRVARFFQQNAHTFGVKYMIWRQRTWTTGSRVGNWHHMGSRGSRTANHMDHVHITVRNGHSGDALKQALSRARAES